MEKDIIVQWKNQLQSKLKREQLTALQEIGNSLAGSQENKEVYILQLINCDLSYFLSEILIYKLRLSTNLVIKIVCHLSEVPGFFKNDFFRYTRSFLRLLNSFPQNSPEDVLYQQSILHMNIIVLRRYVAVPIKKVFSPPINFKFFLNFNRAQIFHADFNDERFPKLGFVIAAGTLKCLDVSEKLEFVNAVVDILLYVDVNSNDKIYRDRKLLEILHNLKINAKDLLNADYFVRLSNFLHNIIRLLSATTESEVENSILLLITEKFMVIMKFILQDARDLQTVFYEIFLNLLHYILRLPAFSCKKYAILNRFLTLNGLNFLIFFASSFKDNPLSCKIIGLKSRVVLAQIMLHIVKLFYPSDTEFGENNKLLRGKFLNITFNCDFNPQAALIENIADLSRETLMFIVFKYFVMLKWNMLTKTKGELLSSMAFIIQVFQTRKISMDVGIISMLFYVYTSNYVYIKGNELLDKSSLTLMKYVRKTKIIIDFKFYKWWTFFNWRMAHKYKAVLSLLISPTCSEQFYDLTEDDLPAINITFIMAMFTNKKTPVENLEKLTRILCCCRLNLRDYGKLLTFYEKQKSAQDRRISINILNILCSTSTKLNKRLQNKVFDIAQKSLLTFTNLHERLLAIQLLVKSFKTQDSNQKK